MCMCVSREDRKCVLKKKRNKRRCHPILFFIRFFNVQQAQFVAKFLTNIEYNNFLVEERVNLKKMVEGTQNRIKKIYKNRYL